jgi:hypothetical protein
MASLGPYRSATRRRCCAPTPGVLTAEASAETDAMGRADLRWMAEVAKDRYFAVDLGNRRLTWPVAAGVDEQELIIPHTTSVGLTLPAMTEAQAYALRIRVSGEGHGAELHYDATTRTWQGMIPGDARTIRGISALPQIGAPQPVDFMAVGETTLQGVSTVPLGWIRIRMENPQDGLSLLPADRSTRRRIRRQRQSITSAGPGNYVIQDSDGRVLRELVVLPGEITSLQL